jgi:flagellar biosynthesis protein
MSTPSSLRRVSLRLAGGNQAEIKPLPPETLEALLARAQVLGLPLHHDPQIAALLTGLRLREDVPALLYAAAASVLAAGYGAAEEQG